VTVSPNIEEAPVGALMDISLIYWYFGVCGSKLSSRR
jgi:hypothetical protein